MCSINKIEGLSSSKFLDTLNPVAIFCQSDRIFVGIKEKKNERNI